MKSVLLTLLTLLAFANLTFAQVKDTLPRQKFTYSHHRVNPWISVPAIVLGTYASVTRLKKLQGKPMVELSEIENLDPNDINGFDRWVVRQPVRDGDWAAGVSDQLFAAGELAPLTLLIWKKYRREFLPIGLMFLEAQATQGLFYGYAPFGPSVVERFRPRVYYEEMRNEGDLNGETRNSMFSGHVSTTSTGFFFLARMIDDYNPQLNTGQKFLLYGAATVPGLFSAYLRVRAFKHYPSDTLVGLGVGAFSGIMIPQFHKWWAKRHRSRAMLQPVTGGGAVGLNFNMQF